MAHRRESHADRESRGRKREEKRLEEGDGGREDSTLAEAG